MLQKSFPKEQSPMLQKSFPNEQSPMLQKSFPNEQIVSIRGFLDEYCAMLAAALESIDRAQVERAVEILSDALDRDATIFCCGNGGSAAIANHMVCDHQKGVSTDTIRTPKVVSLSSNVELVTAIANDIGFEDVFSHALRLHARRGDVLVTISSSGNSREHCPCNVYRVLYWNGDDRHVGVRRGPESRAGRCISSCRLRQLRSHRRCSPDLYARAGTKPPHESDVTRILGSRSF